MQIDENGFRDLIQPYRRELRAHCYRMAGSLHDADDLLQESLLRAWRGIGGFEGRASVRTWLYKVTTSACLDALDRRSARRLPHGPGGPPPNDAGASMSIDGELTWIEPCPDDIADATPPSPEARYGARESVALAFLAALQLLPPKQRAVLVLHDVIGWEAADCATLLSTTVAAVNSALQRARETLSTHAGAVRRAPSPPEDAKTSALLARYVQAWEEADVGVLVSLLREDATLAMPPIAAWFQGAEAIGASIAAMVLTPDAHGTYRLVATHANGLPAFAAYARDPVTGQLRAMAIHVLTIEDGRIAAIDAFLTPALFPAFSLPATWEN